MIRAVVVDDEKPVREAFIQMLREDFPEVEVLAVCENVPEAVKTVKEVKPDLVFLDVEMPPFTGFDFLEQVKNQVFEVIFTTSHNKYALQAIKFSALDYLLKPFDADDLAGALERYKEKVNKNNTQSQFEMLLRHMKAVKDPPGNIALPTLNGLTFLKLEDIIRCESDNNYTTFHLTNKNKILVSRPLKEYEEMLEESNFFRIHHKHLINLAHIKSYTRGEGGSVTMVDDSEVDVARRRKDEFLTRIGNR